MALKVTVVAIAVILVLDVCAVQTCNDQEFSICATKYGLEVGLRMIEGFDTMCKKKSTMKNDFLNCVSVKAGCSEHEALMGQLADAINEMFDEIICSATMDCSMASLISCYGNLLTNLNVQIPTDTSQHPKFLDDITKKIYNDVPAYCSEAESLNYDDLATCMSGKLTRIFSDCTTNSRNKMIQLTHDQSAADQYTGMIRRSMSNLMNAQQLKSATTAVCGSGCENYAEKYDGMKTCTTNFLEKVLSNLDKGDLTNYVKDSCKAATEFVTCSQDNVLGCAPLRAQVEGQMSDLLDTCKATYDSSAHTHTVVSLWMMLGATLMVLLLSK